MRKARLVLALAIVLCVPRPEAPEAANSKPRSATVSVWRAGAWRPWWRSDRAPTRWLAPDPELTGALSWKRLDEGLEWASLRLACGAPAWRARLIVARLDPSRLELSLVMDLSENNLRPGWSIDRAPEDALLAVNAGQFLSTMPWGWVVIDGVQRLGPGAAPLASAFFLDDSGRVGWIHGELRRRPPGVVNAFQSYPTLLTGDGIVPAALRTPGSGVNLTHRDARLALGEDREGWLLVALTRFDVAGDAASAVPLGPTTPEMAAIMGALGARDAVMLDGGISAQLLLHGRDHAAPLKWRGFRKVPLALIARPR